MVCILRESLPPLACWLGVSKHKNRGIPSDWVVPA